MGSSPEEARARAEAKFQKQQQAEQQASEAKLEREAQARAVEAHTARLKSLRLAKDAPEKETVASHCIVRRSIQHARAGNTRKHH